MERPSKSYQDAHQIEQPTMLGQYLDNIEEYCDYLEGINKDFAKEAYEAGEAAIEEEVHYEEFCIGDACSCEGKRLDYEDFEQWYELRKNQDKN